MTLFDAVTFLVKLFVYAALATGLWYLVEQAIKAYKDYIHRRIKTGDSVTIPIDTISAKLDVGHIVKVKVLTSPDSVGTIFHTTRGPKFTNNSGDTLYYYSAGVCTLAKISEGEYLCLVTFHYKRKGVHTVLPNAFICYTEQHKE